MGSYPKYSIIVPVYNCGDCLKSCIDSILGQTFDNFELLIVDDGSTDGSENLCDWYSVQDARVRVFHKENGGASSARNAGIDNALGEWILFADGDDSVKPCTLADINEAMLANRSTQMIVFGVYFEYIRENEIVKQEVLSCKHAGVYASSELIEEFGSFFWDNAFSGVWNKVFLRSAIDSSGLRFSNAMVLYEDLEFVLRYLLICDAALFVDRPYYHYRISVRKDVDESRFGKLEVLHDNMRNVMIAGMTLNSKGESESLSSTMANLYIGMLYRHLLDYAEKLDMGLLLDYCKNEVFRFHASKSRGLSNSNKQIYDLIISGDSTGLSRMLRKEKTKRATRRIVKRILRKA